MKNQLYKTKECELHEYFADPKYAYEFVSESDDYFEISIMNNVVRLAKNDDGEVSRNSLALLKYYGANLFDETVGIGTLLDAALDRREHIYTLYLEELPISKELYISVKVLAPEAESYFMAVKVNVKDTSLYNYVNVFNLKNNKEEIMDLNNKINELVNINNAEFMNYFSDLEFLYATKEYNERYFYLDNGQENDGFFKRSGSFKRTKLSFYVRPLLSFGSRSEEEKIVEEKKKEITFDDVYCLDEIVDQFREIGELITNYKKYEELGVRLPYGILLVGKPGTGKTLITNAFINEYGLKRYEYREPNKDEAPYVDSIEDVFQKARRNAPAVIIIDEIDKISIPSAMFTEMSGQLKNNGVIVIATANSTGRIPNALLRSGRFDRKIYFESLSNDTIKKMLIKRLGNAKINYDLDLDMIVDLMPSPSGADIDTYVNEAKLKLTLTHEDVLTNAIFINVINLVDNGYIKPRVYSEEQKAQIRLHEAGHAVVAIALNGPECIARIDTNSPVKADGFVQLNRNEGGLVDTNALNKQIKIALGGIMAEKLFATSVSVGAEDDLISVNYIVEQMITNLGLSSLTSITTNMFATPFSQATEAAKNKVIDEGTKIIAAAEKEVEQILLANKSLLMSLVSLLKEQPVLFRRDIVELVNKQNSVANEISLEVSKDNYRS